MRILMFANTYLNLYQPVVDELRSQGHYVSIIKDFFEYFDPKNVERQYRLNKRKNGIWNNSVDSYWKNHEQIIAEGYDIFISFNGSSINHTSFELIDRYSPNIIKIQYCWDSFNCWDLRMIEGFFDVRFSFDVVDAQNRGWKLLPSFFVKEEIAFLNTSIDEDIDFFMIGSDHDRRYSFLRKLLPAINSESFNNYLKIYTPPISNKVLNFLIDSAKTLLDFTYLHELLFKYGFVNNDIRINKYVDNKEYARIMARSKFILDDNRKDQAGLSPRFIRAVAMNKKIITTNKWALRYSFVDNENVCIVDKQNPKIDIDTICRENLLQLTLYLRHWNCHHG